MNQRWRIDELAKLAEKALAQASYDGQGSGRVRDVPDVRTIRYYITLGLLDRPSEMQGRTAFYGRKHLLQLVAIKRLQAQGLSLVDVQQQMLGIGPKKLASLAELPEGFFERDWSSTLRAAVSPQPSAPNAKAAAAPARARSQFWAAVPQPRQFHEVASQSARQPLPAVILPLADGVSLLMEGVDPARLSREALAALAAAGAQVKDVLHGASLINDADSRRAGEPEAGQSAANPQPTGE
jgi:DNA-binding transcriptional MerR regulator